MPPHLRRARCLLPAVEWGVSSLRPRAAVEARMEVRESAEREVVRVRRAVDRPGCWDPCARSLRNARATCAKMAFVAKKRVIRAKVAIWRIRWASVCPYLLVAMIVPFMVNCAACWGNANAESQNRSMGKLNVLKIRVGSPQTVSVHMIATILRNVKRRRS